MTQDLTVRVVSTADLVEEIGQREGKFPVSRKYVDEALRQILSGEEDEDYYFGGGPHFERIYDFAIRLQDADATRN